MAAQNSKAISDASQSIAIIQQVVGEEIAHPDIASMHGLIGDCHLQLDQMTEAHEHYRKMSQILLSVHSGDILQSSVREALKKVKLTKKVLQEPGVGTF